MTDEAIKQAWRGDAPPPDCEPIEFLILRDIYREYKKGDLERDMAEQLKEFCMSFTELAYKERRSLLVYALNSEFESNGRLEDIKALVWALVKETG